MQKQSKNWPGVQYPLKEEKKEEEMKEKTKHHKHNISAGFHPGIDKKSNNFSSPFLLGWQSLWLLKLLMRLSI